MFEIEFYQLPNGTKPAEEFLDSLDTKMRAKALHSLSILEEFGNQLREPYSKQLEDGLFELRIKFAVTFPDYFISLWSIIRSLLQMDL